MKIVSTRRGAPITLGAIGKGNMFSLEYGPHEAYLKTAEAAPAGSKSRVYCVNLGNGQMRGYCLDTKVYPVDGELVLL